MDRYDDLMLGLYGGHVPTWLPPASRMLFRRESLRRRCALGQTLASSFRCTVYCAQSLRTTEISAQVFAAWADARHRASNVVTGLYLALEDVLAKTEGLAAVVDLLRYEALAIPDLRCAPHCPRLVDRGAVPGAGGGAEVYRFDFAVPEIHGRMTLYAGASAPASFVDEYDFPRRRTYVARTATASGWSIADVSDEYDPVIDNPSTKDERC